jgi:valyl-tRNA synthetase
MIKPAYLQPVDACTHRSTLAFFDALLKLLHPFMPFITEELWQALEERQAGESLMIALLPEAAPCDDALLSGFESAREVITAIRAVRSQKNIPMKDALELEITGPFSDRFHAVVAKMSNLSAIRRTDEKSSGAVSFLAGTTEFAIPLGKSINEEEELEKLQEELRYQQGFLASVMKKLDNENFVSKAPAGVIAIERKKQSDAESKIKTIRESIAMFKRL